MNEEKRNIQDNPQEREQKSRYRKNAWHHFLTITHHKLLVYPRPGYPLDASALPDGVDLLGAPVFDVSSTRVRKLLRENGDASRLVPAPVLRYIKERHLYS